MTREGLQRHQRAVAQIRRKMDREFAQRQADIHQYLALRIASFRTLCPKCDGELTETDMQTGHCTQCKVKV